MDLKELETEALKVSPDLRARCAETVWQCFEALSDNENERLWVEQALLRHDELERSAAAVRSAEDVFRNARSRLP